MLGRADRGGSPGHNHLHLEPDQLGRQVGEPLRLALRIAVLDDDVLALDVAQVAQTLPEGLHTCWGRDGRGERRTEPTDPVHFRRLLCLGDERRHEDTQGEGDDASRRRCTTWSSPRVSLMPTFFFPWKPNAGAHLLPEAGATQERTL